MSNNSNDEIRQSIKSLCMINNKFMNLMLDDNIEAAQIMLRVILKDDTIRVIDVRIQNFIQNIYGHSAQLDILAQDKDGNFFNVEIQRSDEGAPTRRARYYSSILDTHFLQSGADYDELPDSYVIFITENDVLQQNRPIYNISRKIHEDNTDFADGSHIIYVNSQCRDDTALGKLMQDLYCTDPAKLHYHEFNKRMEFLKCTKEGEEKLTDVFEIYAEKRAKIAAEKAAKEATEKATLENAFNLLKKGVAPETIADALNLPLEEVLKLAKQQSA